MSDETQAYATLRKLMTEHMSNDELNVLCFDLGLDYDDLSGDSKVEKIIDLLQDIRRRQQLERLLEVGKALRADITWDVALVARAVAEPLAAEPPAPLVEAQSFAAALPPAVASPFAFSPPGTASTPPQRSALELRSALAAVNSKDVLFYPGIPQNKIATAFQQYQIPEGETIVALVDNTVFRSAKHGVAFCLGGIYYHNDWSCTAPGPGFVMYADLAGRAFAVEGKYEVALGFGQFVNLAGGGVTNAQLVAMLSSVKELLAA